MKMYNNPEAHELNNWSYIFDEPQKPKISTRKFVNSAKINLNKYWNKLEEMIHETTKFKKSAIKKKLKIINQQVLNNRIHPLKPQPAKPEDLKMLVTKRPKSKVEKNVAKGRYSQFLDDSFYHGVNLNLPPPSLTEPISVTPAMAMMTTMTLPKYYDNYCYYIQELQKEINCYNNSVFYQKQLNESIRRKGHKFTLADIEALESPKNTQRLYDEDEGYLV